MSVPRFGLIDARDRPFAPAPSVEPGCGLDRRQALALLSAGMAAALSACGKPHEEIVPYVEQPTGLTPGVPQRYATALTLNGYARGATAIAAEGRPIKLEGAPGHPYSLGSTDVFVEAEVLSLYDPGRARFVSNADGPASWEALEAALQPRLAAARAARGAGLTILTGRTVSPTELRLIAALRAAMPSLAWRRFEPVNDDAARAGARLAFGRPLDTLPRLDQADVVLCLDADPLGPGPEQIRNGRGFVAARDPAPKDRSGGRFSRLYAVEPGWSLTGANADHRLALHPALIRNLTLAVASGLGGPASTVELLGEAARFAQACAADLRQARRGLVLAGRSQPAQVHALAHWMNARLQAPVSAIAPLDPHPDDHGASLAALVQDLDAGRVQTLVILGANPVYDAPTNLKLQAAIRRAPFSLHCTAFENETSAVCSWRAPLAHPLESWGDARAADGTTSIVQPLIRPLHAGRTPAQVLAILGGAETPSAYELVRQTWTAQAPLPAPFGDQASSPTLTASGQTALAPTGEAPADQVRGDLAPASLAAANRAVVAEAPPSSGLVFGSAGDPTQAAQTTAAQTGQVADAVWKRWLTDGVIPDTAAAPVVPPAPAFPHVAPSPAPQGFTLTLSPDPTLYDGARAENAWLQECPKPMTSEVWGASLAVSPHDAASLGLKDFDHVRLSGNGTGVTAPVRIVAGQAQGVLSGFLGGGRTQAGPIGGGVGFDFAPLRTLASPWVMTVKVEKARGRGGPPSFQALYRVEGEARKLSPVVEVAALSGLAAHPVQAKAMSAPSSLSLPSLLPPNPADSERHEPAWAMVIDQASCISCNACVVSCQAENNVPVVGPQEVARGRTMQWLRIDTYDVGDAHESRPAFQPVPCMQCEHAPCEPVCPVEASIHDHEGLNDQVYNRCIGTRFCQSNCPYKVRRFNWFGYAHDQAYANLGAESYKAQKNPEVTVRARGVMEKCTYCVQRISGARRAAEREGREIGAHEVVTACQSACPTQAISFGDLNNKGSGIAARREDPRHFALLAELGTRPRTTYLARLRNPNPALTTAERGA